VVAGLWEHERSVNSRSSGEFQDQRVAPGVDPPSCAERQDRLSVLSMGDHDGGVQHAVSRERATGDRLVPGCVDARAGGGAGSLDDERRGRARREVVGVAGVARVVAAGVENLVLLGGGELAARR
jgi:hypothetical protein